MNNSFKSRNRVTAHGEVFTAEREVKAMCDLVKDETERIESRFLEPACGEGNFLAEVLRRKLAVIKECYEYNAVRAVKSLYGIELLQDNADICRKRLYEIWLAEYFRNMNAHANERLREEVQGILNENIKCGDALTLKHADGSSLTFRPEITAIPFDVIIGNPPYHASTNGSVESQATPVYNKFAERAVELAPRYIVMITPARWFNGGFGLSKFRGMMLNDARIRVIHDYTNAEDCFPGLNIKGGVCYFKWDRDNPGLCKVYSHRGDGVAESERPLLEPGLSTFIRWGEAVEILRKVSALSEALGEPSFSSIVSPRDPFKLNSYENGREIMFKDFARENFDGSVVIYSQGWTKNGPAFIDRRRVTARPELLDKYKVYISKAYGAGEKYPHQILNKPFLGAPGTCCNMTYLTIGGYEKKETALNVISYMRTKFFRFLVSLLKNTQNAYRQVYKFVPMQDFSEPWTEEKLRVKYNLTAGETAFIDSVVRPME